MKTYDFTFIVDADPHSEGFEDRFIGAGCDDATFILMRGAAAISFDREAPSYRAAVLSAYQQIKSVGAGIIRFEPDFLVSASDIAERSGLTRAAIGLFSKGERRDDFPAPCARIGTANPLWDWVDVSKWLVQQGKLDETVHRDAIVSRLINASAQFEHAGFKSNINVEVEIQNA